jgi:transposase
MPCEKKITRAYKAKLPKAKRKEFRCLMWEFRRHPKDLSPEERQKLEALFGKIPALEKLYRIRVRFQEIFDTAPDQKKAAKWLCALELEAMDAGLDLTAFFLTYDKWEEEILNYFDARQTSAAVEGINNKARVIIKRAYGLKSAESLWSRLILDLNWAKEVIGCTIEKIRGLVAGFKAIFDPSCT